MPKYSIPRQIWRIIYPLLIFLGVSLLVALVVMVAYGFIVGFQYAMSGGALDPESLQTTLVDAILESSLWVSLATSAICILIFGIMWGSAKKRLPKYSGTKLKVLSVILSVFLFVGLNYILASVISLTNLIQHFPSHEIVEQFITSGGLVVRILAVGLLAPVVEELMCRGIILTRLCTWMPTWVAVLVSSALFGIIHLNLLQGIYAFIIGLLFAWLYIRYRNLWLPIIAHVAFNLAGIILYEILGAMGVVEFNHLLMLIPSILVAVVCLLLFIKCTKTAVFVQEPGDETGTTPVISPQG